MMLWIRYRPNAPSMMAILAALVVAYSNACQGVPPTPSRTIKVRDLSEGCEHHKELSYEFSETNGQFVHSKHVVDSVWVDRLRAKILSSHADKSGLLIRLGITPESVRSHHDDLVAAALSKDPEDPRVIPPTCASLFEFEHVAKTALDYATLQIGGTTSVLLEVTFSGQPQVIVRTKQERPWMLPWTVQVGDKQWETFDIEIPRLLSKLVEPGGPNAEYVDGSGYWAEEFWKDTDVWGPAIGWRLNAEHARNLYESLKGFGPASEIFIVDRAEVGDINSQPRSLFLELHARRSMPVDSVRWWNPLKEGHPTVDWTDLMRLHADACRACVPFTWLNGWKSAHPGRSIELQAVGRRGWEETNLDFEVLPAWRTAGMKGDPEFQLLLRRDDHTWGKVFVSAQDGRVLSLKLTQAEERHWLDKLQVAVPEFVTIDHAGNLQRLRIPN